MDRVEFINEMFKKLEENHIFLYHDISKEDFEKHKNEFLKKVYELDETHFEAGILKLFALFKDAHAFYDGTDFNYVSGMTIKLINKDFYIKCDNKFKKIKKINGYDIDEIVKRLKEIISYEVESWAYGKISRWYLYSPKAMEMIDCGLNENKIVYQCEDGQEVIAFVSNEKQNFQNSKPLYERKFYDNNVLYIRYSSCSNMKDYPFKEFVEDIKKECKELPKACLVDVRNNTGGSDVVILPLSEWLKENNIKSYMLMNETTVSSGIFALGSFKKKLNATLIGTEAGQPTICYGNMRIIELDGKAFTYCTRYFELTSCHDKNAPVEYYNKTNLEYFDYVGVVKPDIKIEVKLEDLNNGIDTQLEESLKIINKDIQIYRDEPTLEN